MQIVIDIPQAYYELVISRCKDPVLLNAFNNGNPLPKEHGDIVDISELMDMLCLEDNAYNRDNNIAELITLDDIDRLDVIIPADKGE